MSEARFPRRLSGATSQPRRRTAALCARAGWLLIVLACRAAGAGSLVVEGVHQDIPIPPARVNTSVDLTLSEVPADLPEITSVTLTGDSGAKLTAVHSAYDPAARKLTLALLRGPKPQKYATGVLKTKGEEYTLEFAQGELVDLPAYDPIKLDFSMTRAVTAAGRIQLRAVSGASPAGLASPCEKSFRFLNLRPASALQLADGLAMLKVADGIQFGFALAPVKSRVTGAKVAFSMCEKESVNQWAYEGVLPDLLPTRAESMSKSNPIVKTDDAQTPVQEEARAPLQEEKVEETVPPAQTTELESSPGEEVGESSNLPWDLIFYIAILLALVVAILLAWKHKASILPRQRPQGHHQVFPAAPEVPTAPATGDRSAGAGRQPELLAFLSQQLDPLAKALEGLQLELRGIQSDITSMKEEVRVRRLEPPVAYQGSDDLESGSGLPANHRLPSFSAMPLAELVSAWWSAGAHRADLAPLIQGSPYDIKTWCSADISETLRYATNRTFSFRPTEGPVEWLACAQQGDFLVVPADPRLFETGDSLKFLGSLFDGIGTSLDRVRFRRVVKACRLRLEPGGSHQFKLTERGRLEVEGHAGDEPRSSPAPARIPAGDHPAPLSDRQPATIRSLVEDVIGNKLSDLRRGLSGDLQTFVNGRLQATSETARLERDVLPVLGKLEAGQAGIAQLLTLQAGQIDQIAGRAQDLAGTLERLQAELLRRQPPSPPGEVSEALPSPTSAEEVIADQRRPSDPEVIDAPMPETVTPRTGPPGSGEMSDELLEPTGSSLWERLRKWWPEVLPSPDSAPAEFKAGEPPSYIWCLNETSRSLLHSAGARGWSVDLVHVTVPDGTSAGARSPQLQIHAMENLDGHREAKCRRCGPISDSLPYQLALKISGDDGSHLALLPAAGLPVGRHLEAYSRLTGGHLPGSATRITRVCRPAILRAAGGDLFTVVLPLRADFA